MKTLGCIFLMLACLTSYAENYELTRLLNERQKQSAIYTSLADSAIPGKLMKSYLVNNQLQKVIAIDDNIILYTNQLAYSNAALSDSLVKAKSREGELSFDNDRLQQRVLNDMQMLLILKVAAALMIVIILVMLYLYFTLKSKAKDENTVEQSQLDEIEDRNQNMLSEIDRLKINEITIKQELERNIQLHNSQLASIYEKYKILEAENLSLMSLTKQKGTEYQNYSSTFDAIKEERDQLLKQKAELQQLLTDAKSKNETVMKKIGKLIADLSSVNA